MRTKEFNKVKPYCYILTRLSDGKKYFGYRKAIMWGGILMALGHFTMAFPILNSMGIKLNLLSKRLSSSSSKRLISFLNSSIFWYFIKISIKKAAVKKVAKERRMPARAVATMPRTKEKPTEIYYKGIGKSSTRKVKMKKRKLVKRKKIRKRKRRKIRCYSF